MRSATFLPILTLALASCTSQPGLGDGAIAGGEDGGSGALDGRASLDALSADTANGADAMGVIDATDPADAARATDAAGDSGIADATASPDSGGSLDASPPADAASPDAQPPQCPTFGSPPPITDESLPAASPGRAESTSVNGFQDEYLYDSADYIKIGVRREWGGSVVFFGLANGRPGVNASNAIDANDTGREVQVAIYDPERAMQNCAGTASCRTTPTTCPASITYLGWNPVQGGNRCNRGSPLSSLSNAGGILSLATQPLHWNPNWDASDCDSSGCSNPALAARASDVLLTQRLRFVRQHVVELRYTVRNLAAIDHLATVQEMPTLYTSNGDRGPNLRRLRTSDGTEIAIDIPAGGDGFFYKNFTSPEPWVTLQDDNSTYGVGIYYENGERDFQGWQSPTIPFNNVRAQVVFGLPANGVVEARAYLILGAYTTVASEAAWLKRNLAPFGALDAPAAGATVVGTTTVSGWALDDQGVASVVARVDESIDVPLTYGSLRSDVCAVWPGYPACDAVGFRGRLDLGGLAASCDHLLEIVATDGDGNQRIIARRLVHVGP